MLQVSVSEGVIGLPLIIYSARRYERAMDCGEGGGLYPWRSAGIRFRLTSAILSYARTLEDHEA